jgi:predicted ATPase
MKNNWFVITGGPSSGKTTTVDLLSKKGYKTTEESARKHFESQIKKGLTLEEIRGDQEVWQNAISKLQSELEKSLNPEETIFFDRAFPDTIAYYRFLNIKIPEEYTKLYNASRYKKVFLLEPLPLIKDNLRTETDEQALLISEAIHNSYSNLFLEIVKIPVMSPGARVEFILEQIAS